MLEGKVLVRLDEANRSRVTHGLKRLLIAAPQEAIGAIDLPNREVGNVSRNQLGNETRQLSRRRIVLRADEVHSFEIRAFRKCLAEHADDPGFRGTVATDRIP